MKATIRRQTQGPWRWVVTRPTYGFGRYTLSVATYATWEDAMRSVLYVSLGGAGQAERSTGSHVRVMIS